MAQVKQNQVEQAGATDRVYRIAELYKTSVAPALMAKFGYKNVNEVPRLVKIVLNMGLGDVKDNTKSFSGFFPKIREHISAGCGTSLRSMRLQMRSLLICSTTSSRFF